jgi:hypothetical protein
MQISSGMISVSVFLMKGLLEVKVYQPYGRYPEDRDYGVRYCY